MTDERSSAFGVVQRTIELLDSIPNLVVAILAMVVFQPGIVTISIAIGLIGWTYMARIVCGKMLQLKDQEFGLAFFRYWQVSPRVEAPHTQLAWAHNNLRDCSPYPMRSSRSRYSASSGSGSRYLCQILISFTLFGDGPRDALDPRMGT
jgi:hypothetical protein